MLLQSERDFEIWEQVVEMQLSLEAVKSELATFGLPVPKALRVGIAAAEKLDGMKAQDGLPLIEFDVKALGGAEAVSQLIIKQVLEGGENILAR